MNINAKLLVIAFILAIFSIGAVAAVENVTLDNSDFTQVPHEQVVSVAEPTVQEVETIDLETSDTKDTAVTNEITSGSDDLKSTDSINESLSKSKKGDVLGLSNQENVLATTIHPSGSAFSDIRDAIALARDGDIIDLEGKTFYGFGGHIVCEKAITIANGKLDGNSFTSTFTFAGCVLENLSVSNLHTPGGTTIRNCQLNNVLFDNILSDTSCDFLVRNSKFENVNFTNCHSLMPADPKEEDFERGVMIVSYYSTYNNCYFINCSSNRHSGAICVAGEPGNTANITNCVFDNCTSGVGGAVYLHGTGLNANLHSNIINCIFKNCEATEWGGAVGSSQDYLNVDNCDFINNTAKQGAAIMVGGITHGLDGDNSEGNYNTINKCFFHNNTGTDEGGAIHITGDNNNVIKSHFDDNYAHGGDGAAIYVKGENATVIDSEFFRHDCDKGTVYIQGNNAKVEDSTFEDNFATFGGAGVYIIGNEATLNGNTFQRNDAADQGGAVHVEGNHAKILNSFFYNNNAIPDVDDKDQGLGGAIYIKGNHNEISYSFFEGNTARNGSAIYNNGLNLTLNDDYFHNNQAWSYLLFTVIKPNTTSYYNESAHTIVEITHIGGDNIINAIHNAGSIFDIFFHNVTYYHSEGVHNTGSGKINPVDGVQNSKNGTVLYQDDREDLQIVDVIVTKDENGEVIFDSRGQDLRTGLYGNLTIVLRQGLRPGNYTINATHPDDLNYTAITNITHFEILPHVDVSVTKTSNKDIYFVGENAIFTIEVYGVGTNATDVKVKDFLPQSFRFVSASATKGSYDRTNNIWDIGFLPHGASETLTLTVQTTELGTFDNVVNVTCTEKDWDLSNNVDNKTIHVDLYYTKEANVTQTSAGEHVEYYLTVFNTGSQTYTEKVLIRDLMPAGIRYQSYELAGADLIKFTNYAVEQVWEITNISARYPAKITVKAVTLNDGLWNNTMQVWDYPSVNETVNVSSNADLQIIKSASVVNVNKGDVFNWTIIVINHGPSIAFGVYVDDILPAGLEIVGRAIPSGDTRFDRTTGRWTIGNMGVGDYATLIIPTRVTTSGINITNVAIVNSTTPDPNPSNNEDNDTVYFNPDVGIEKLVSTQSTYHGETITWTLNVTNNGPNTATGVYVIDRLPSGLRYVGSSHSKGNAYNPGTGRWYVGTLEEGESATLTIYTTVTSYDGYITNNATVYATNDNNGENNYAENFTQVNTEADVSIVKLVSNQTAHHGDEIYWTVIATNNGPNAAENVYVIDFLPTDQLIQTRQPYISKGQIAHLGNNGLWTIGTLESGESATLIVYTRVIVSDETIINSVNITTSTYDPDLSNNWAENGTYVPPECDVQVIKTVNNLTPNKYDTVVWTISVVNTGRDTAEHVVVTDVLPEGLQYVSHEPASRGTFEHDEGIWTIGDLEVNSRQTLRITTQVVDTGNITNEVTVTTKTYDIDETNNYDNETIDVPALADLEIIKTVSNKTPKYGDLINWTITVKNNGPDKARNVVVIDKLPAGLIYVTDSTGAEDYNPYSGKWTIGTLDVINPVSLIITTRVNITNATINNVAVVTSTTPDSDDSNNEANNTTFVGPEADLAIVKDVNDHGPKKGNVITWKITVVNNGPDVAVNAYAIDVLPGGLIFESSDGDGEYDPETHIWTIGDMENGDTRVLYIVTTVDVAEAIITNTVNVTSETPDPDETNNEDDSIIDVGHETDLELIKTVSNSTPRKGDNITWNITVINHGPHNSIETVVTDILPDGLVWISDDSNGAYNPVTGIWDIGTLKSNTNVTLIIKTLVNITNDTITNVAVVDCDTHEIDKSNNEDNDTVKVQPEADLLLYKFVNVPNSYYNGEVVWTIYVLNKGPDTAVDAYVYDKLPDGLIYNKSNATIGKYNETTNIWTIGNLTKGSSAYLTIFTTVNITNGTITNYAVVNSSTYDPNPDNNNDSVSTEVESVADLQVIKTVSDIKSSFGDIITWTITVTNNGPCDAYDVNVTDSLPDGLIYNGHYTANGTYNSSKGLWTIGELINGSSVYLEIYAIVNVTNATITNVAVVNSTTPDSNESNNKANNTTYVDPIADLEIVKFTIDSPTTYDDVVIWTIWVTNNGPDAAKDVYVEDILPEEVRYYFHVNDVGLYDPTKGIWFIGDMENGDFHYLSILTIVEITEGNITNVAVVNSSTPDNNTDNNVDNDTVEVIDTNADLEVIKLVSDETAKYDDLIIWTIIVTNNGPDVAYGAYVIDELPGELRYVSHRVDVGLYDPSSGIWYIGDMENGDSFNLIIYSSVIIDEGNITNVAVVNSSTPDNNPDNNEANNTTVVNEFNADLEVVKYVSDAKANYGDTVVWTIVITNNGPDVAYDAYVIDKLPEGLTYVSHEFDNGLYDPSMGIWYLGDMESGKTFTLIITTIVNIDSGNITNVAVADSTTPDNNTDNNIANNTTTVDDVADLAVVKVVSNKNPKFGEEITWTITVTNKGPSDAKNVKVTDKLPAGLIFQSSDGNYNPATGIWTVGDLTNGESASLVIKTIVGITNATITNIAVVTSDTPDSNKTNNEGNDTADVDPEADLEIVKIVNNSNPNKGDIIRWVLIITNNGPDAAVNVKIVDEIPVGLSVVVDGRVINTRTITIELPEIKAGQTITEYFDTLVDVTNANITNVASVTSDTYDPNETNNKDDEKIVVPPEADLEIIKLVSDKTSSKGDVITWTIVVTNKGPDGASNIYVKDNLPSGLVYSAHTTTKGLFDSNSFTWYINALNDGESATLTISTLVNVTDKTLTNSVNVTNEVYDPNENNNRANNTTDVDKELHADLEVIKVVSDANPHKGDVITWTITVTNNGPGNAKDVTVTDKLPAGLKFIAADGNYDENTGVWTIGDLANGKTVSLVIRTLVDITNANITNVAVVNSTTPDDNPGNNRDNEIAEIDPEADIKVVKVVSNPTPNEGDTITWTIIVTNLGPDASENVVVKETLPEGLTLVSSKGSKGEFSDDTWTIGTLENGEIATLTLTTKVTASGGTITNVVTASSSTYDPNETNNKDSEKTTPKSPGEASADLEIIKIADKAKVKVGDVFIWTITVINHGPDKAEGVYVEEMLDTDFYELIAYKVSKGTFSPDDGEWLIGNMEDGERVTLEIMVKALVEGDVENYASVDSDTPDPNPDNNDAYAVVVVEEDDEGNDVPHKGSKYPSTPKQAAPTMHATGNPIVMVLLALLSIAGVTLRRKN